MSRPNEPSQWHRDLAKLIYNSLDCDAVDKIAQELARLFPEKCAAPPQPATSEGPFQVGEVVECVDADPFDITIGRRYSVVKCFSRCDNPLYPDTWYVHVDNDKGTRIEVFAERFRRTAETGQIFPSEAKLRQMAQGEDEAGCVTAAGAACAPLTEDWRVW